MKSFWFIPLMTNAKNLVETKVDLLSIRINMKDELLGFHLYWLPPFLACRRRWNPIVEDFEVWKSPTIGANAYRNSATPKLTLNQDEND
jgi:hypothetical protein